MFKSKISAVFDLGSQQDSDAQTAFSVDYERRRPPEVYDSTKKPSLEALVASGGSPKLEEDFEDLDLSADPASEQLYTGETRRPAGNRDTRRGYYTEKYLGYEPTLPRSAMPRPPPKPSAPERVPYANLAAKQVELRAKQSQVAQARARILKIHREKMQAESQISQAEQLIRKQQMIQETAEQAKELEQKEMEYWREEYLARKSSIAGRDEEIEYNYREKVLEIREEKRQRVAKCKAEEARLLERAAKWNKEDAERLKNQVQSFRSQMTHNSELKRSEYADRARQNGCFSSVEQLGKVEAQIKEQNELLEQLLNLEEWELVECVKVKERRVIVAGSTL